MWPALSFGALKIVVADKAKVKGEKEYCTNTLVCFASS
jgi:hypothetical protein